MKLFKIINFIKTIFFEKILDSFFNFFNYELIPRHYYSNIPEKEDLFFLQKSSFSGIKIDEEKQLNLLKKFKPYFKEFNQNFSLNKSTKSKYHIINGNYMAGDGHLYYSFIRQFKPKKIIEVGCGNSTKLAMDAIKKNQSEGFKTEITCIEPYRSEILKDLNVKVIPKKVQEIDLSFFKKLNGGDFLFIDSSHVIKSGNDGWYEYCEILPILNKGVIVHVHDINLPYPYPDSYFKNKLYWNEQFVLKTFLTNNLKAEVIMPSYYL